MPEAILYSRFRLSPPGERPAARPAKTAERADASQTYDDPALAVLARGVDNAFYLNMYKDVADANIDPVLTFTLPGRPWGVCRRTTQGELSRAAWRRRNRSQSLRSGGRRMIGDS